MDRTIIEESEIACGYMRPHLESAPQADSLLDIGAAHGHFSIIWNSVTGNDNISMIEANPLSCSLLEELPWTLTNKAVGKPGKATFYTNTAEPVGGGSSLYKENTEYFDGCAQETIEVVALDDLFLEGDLIKIDVQGAELDVIEHGPETIQKANYLLLELSFMDYNVGAPLIDDILAKTRDLGFKMIDTFGPHYGGHWYKKRKVQADVLLSRKTTDVIL